MDVRNDVLKYFTGLDSVWEALAFFFFFSCIADVKIIGFIKMSLENKTAQFNICLNMQVRN